MSVSPPSPQQEAVIVGSNRIPFARGNTAYADASNTDMLCAALNGLVARFGLAGERLGEVAGGATMKHAGDFNLVREAVLGSALSAKTPAVDIQKACATSVEAAAYVANKIRLGQIDSGIACGADTVSDPPVAVNDGLRRVLVKSYWASKPLEYLRLLGDVRPDHVVPIFPRNEEPRTGLSMGEHQAQTTKQWNVSRAAQDELAVRSHHNLSAAYDAGALDDLITPYLGLERDNNLRPNSSQEKLSTLKPVFGGEDGTMTAANSTPLTDGAAAVLLATRAWAEARDLPVLAKFRDSESAAVDYVHGHEGLLMAPAYAVPRLLQRNNLSLQDFDYYEIHEAFAGTVLSTLAAWNNEEFCRDELGLDAPLGEIDRTKLNVWGSSLATGHPFAATGARVIGTAAKLVATGTNLEHGGRALVSVCAAGGNGVVAIIEK